MGIQYADALQSYIGVLARTNIPISIASWPKVSKTKKSNLWETVLTSFVLGPECKKMVLKSAGMKLREFKSRLTTLYVLPYLDAPKSLQFPPDDYRFITVDDWNVFVKERKSDSFLARRHKNVYDHHMSRKGYEGLREELSKTVPEEEIDRATLWVKGRQTKQGTFKHDVIKDTAEKIETLKRKERDGELTVNGSTDVLTLALGTPEHRGRVRGIGGYVCNPNGYFHLPKRRKESVNESMRQSMRKILEEEKQKLEDELREKICAKEREKIVTEEREKIAAHEREKIAAEEREKIMAFEKAFLLSRIEQLEARVDVRSHEVVTTIGEAKVVVNKHTSGQASCSHAVDSCLKAANKQDNVVEDGAVTNLLDVMERQLLQN
ncbi:putative transposase, Ptta/En/Spm, plant [Rosa chinensis]|uniref:Putative transposase, Ptta/En/Spm, plant n=1 Tax=Rosa chinensis TaxID=74649 RepID=A0A2P6QJ51_ROSCH|nr:putative transposase, Ptta/En/Spm, plant [Rosa chinensis]